MKKSLFILILTLSILTITQVVFARNSYTKSAVIVRGNISYIETLTNLPPGTLPSGKTITLGSTDLLALGVDADVFGKGYSFIMRGSYNTWQYGGDEFEEKISEKDIRITEKSGKLLVKTDAMINAGKAENYEASWGDIVTISIYDKAGKYKTDLLRDVPINQLNSKKFKTVSNATVSVFATQMTSKSDAKGNYQIKIGKGRTALKISADGFIDKIVYVNTTGRKTVLKDVLLEKSNFTLGSRYRYYNFYSDALGNSRNVIIYLPASYMTDTKKRYPVLYMHDGQNIFDESTSGMGMEWRVDETIEKLVSEGKMKEIIVVGIYNTNHRGEEYADYLRSQYADMIVKDIKPIIDARFRTLKQRENTAIMGSSFGALISLYTAYKYPDVFGLIGSLSTAPYKGDIFTTIENEGNKHFAKIWIDTGTAEDNDGHYVKDARKLRGIFEKQGYVVGKNLGYYEVEGALHSETYWAERIWMPLTFLFGK